MEICLTIGHTDLLYITSYEYKMNLIQNMYYIYLSYTCASTYIYILKSFNMLNSLYFNVIV